MKNALKQAMIFMALFFFVGSVSEAGLVSYLNSRGMKSSKSARVVLAKKYGVRGYNFSASKNTELLRKLQVKKAEKADPVVAKDVFAITDEDFEANAHVTPKEVKRVQEGLKTLNGFGADQIAVTSVLDFFTLAAYFAWQKDTFWLFDYRGTPRVIAPPQIAKIEKQAEKKKEAITFEAGKVLRKKKTDATVFGYKDRQDSGWGSPLLNPNGDHCGIKNNQADAEGVALPVKLVASIFGIKPIGYTRCGKAKWDWKDFSAVRTSGIMVKNLRTGKCTKAPVPITDHGPGSKQQANGVEIDLCYRTNLEIGGDGRDPVEYTLIANVFPERSGLDRVERVKTKKKLSRAPKRPEAYKIAALR